MPKPVFIICCESGTEDKYTGMVSLFNIIDRIVGKSRETDSGSLPKDSLTLRIVAVWAADSESDFEGEFNVEMRMLLSPQNLESTLSSDSMRFTPTMPRHRSTVIMGGIQAEASGQLIFESRVRRPTETEWKTQAYTIDVAIIAPDAVPAADGPSATHST